LSLTNVFSIDKCREMMRFMKRIDVCSALRLRSEIEGAFMMAELLGLPSHHDPQKNWDCMKSLNYILEAGDSRAPILDAGSGSNSVILKWLNLLGYEKLYACDVRYKSVKSSFVNYSAQDITQTNYPEGYFQAITSISVIEHGVPLDKFAAEMARLLRPGGLLLVSTDYWGEPIDCKGIYPYGEAMGEMKIFQPHEIDDFVKIALKNGLKLCTPLELRVEEKAVRWERVNREYTFIFLAFRKMECSGL
jgi:SAM-dependent methyltransferase